MLEVACVGIHEALPASMAWAVTDSGEEWKADVS